MTAKQSDTGRANRAMGAPRNATIAFAMLVGITLLDIWCAQSLSQRAR
ncbi:MAG: hypothetical protein JO316_09600 [Abitibacteriaceae bacterium]|nr:hypothetical protein [Abditibacteriaceae bacterium]